MIWRVCSCDVIAFQDMPVSKDGVCVCTHVHVCRQRHTYELGKMERLCLQIPKPFVLDYLDFGVFFGFFAMNDICVWKYQVPFVFQIYTRSSDFSKTYFENNETGQAVCGGVGF